MASFLQLSLLRSFSGMGVPQADTGRSRHEIPLLYQDLLAQESGTGVWGRSYAVQVPMHGVMGFLSLKCH